MAESGGDRETANFNARFRQIDANYPSAAPSAYTAVKGDTLISVARAVWGDGSLWYLIADANGLSSPDSLTDGQSLVIPNKVANINNNVSTFAPYDPSKIIGDTTPATPPPPPPSASNGDKCGGFGQIITTVVSIAVTIVASFYFGPIAGAAIGNIASQATANIVGIQNGFDIRQTLVAAGTAYITQGLGDYGAAGAPIGEQIVRGAANSVVNQGLRIATGLQNSFSWAQVAGSAIAAPIVNSLSDTMLGEQIRDETGNFIRTAGGNTIREGSAFTNALGNTAANVISNTFTGIVSQVIVTRFTGGKINYANIAADAFGNALGNEIGWEIREGLAAEQQRGRLDAALDAQGIGPRRGPGAFAGGNENWTLRNSANGSDGMAFQRDIMRRVRENPLLAGVGGGNGNGSNPYNIAPINLAPLTAPEARNDFMPTPVRAGNYGGSLERVARDQLGPNANQREINNYVGQLFEINNISNARAVQPNQLLNLPMDTTPLATTGLAQYGSDISFGNQQDAMRQARIAQAQADAFARENKRFAEQETNAVARMASQSVMGGGNTLQAEDLYTVRSLVGDAFRTARAEMHSSTNPFERGVWSTLAIASAPFGVANDMAASALNGGDKLYRGTQEMMFGIHRRDAYQFSDGVMNASLGTLDIATTGGLVKSAITANRGLAQMQTNRISAINSYEEGVAKTIPLGPRLQVSEAIAHPSGIGNSLMPDKAQNFITAEPIVLQPGILIYRVVDEKSFSNGGWWTFSLPESRAAVRGDLAVQSKWNAATDYVEYIVPPQGLPAWVGPASSQTARELITTPILPGGGTQIFIPQSRAVIPANLPRKPFP